MKRTIPSVCFLLAAACLCYGAATNTVTWGDQGWPVFGDHGRPVDEWKKPNVGHAYPVSRPETSDEFSGKSLSPIWQWNHNPVNEAWSLDQRRGFLRLKALPADDVSHARNTLTQKLWDDYGTIDIRLDLAGMADGQRAGLTFLSGAAFDWVAAEKTNGICRVTWKGGAGAELNAGRGLRLRGGFGVFCYGANGGYVDLDYVRYRYGSSLP